MYARAVDEQVTHWRWLGVESKESETDSQIECTIG